MRITTFCVHLLFVLFLLTGCVAPVGETVNETAAPAPVVEPDTVRIVMLPFLGFAPFFIAQEEGYFAEQNIELEVLEQQRSTEAITLLIQGEIDVAAGFLRPNMVNAVVRGSTLKAVANKGYLAADGCTYLGLTANKTLVESGELMDVADMQGRRVAFDPAGVEGYYIDRILQEADLTFDDIEIVTVPQPAIYEAMADGSVDLANGGEPWLSRQLASGAAVTWRPAQEVLPDATVAFIFYGPSLLTENPELGVRFMAAYLKAARQYNEGKTERNLAIMAQYTSLDVDFVADSCWLPIPEDAAVNPISVEDYLAWSLAAGLIDEALSVDEIWTTQFVDAATELLTTTER